MMIYLILIVAVAILIALLILLRGFYKLRSDFSRFRKQINEWSDDYVFLINKDFVVKDTNYYDIHKDQQKDQPQLLGNVLRCKNGCDSGMCGTGFACQTCPVRLVIKNSFKNNRDFNQVEATMNLYDKEHNVHEVDVLVNGELVYAYSQPYMMVSVSSSQKAPSVPRSSSSASDTAETGQ